MAVLALAAVACEEEPPPGFEKGSWAVGHRSEIENDCDRRVKCAQRSNPHLRSDAFEHCVSENAQNLNAIEEFRFKWSLGIMRCYQQDDCAYVDCVDADFKTWGEEQRLKIDYICTQKRQCAIDNGTLGVAPQQYLESCRLASVRAADALLPDARPAFTNAYFMCETLTSCAFQVCFPY